MHAHCLPYIHITPSFSHVQNTHQSCRQSARHQLISISIKMKLRIKYKSFKDRRTVMIVTKALKYMYAHCTYTLQPHSHTCRAHINHVASHRDSKLSVLASRRSWESNIELLRRTVYDREPNVLKNVVYCTHYTFILTHTKHTPTMSSCQSVRLEYMTISIKTKLSIKYRVSKTDSVW